jgi:hypothetical protein
MQIEIIERDIVAGTATIKFTHNGVEHTDKYDLGMVIPGTRLELAKQNSNFTEELQDTVIERLTERVRTAIESGIIVNKI